jgi:hypothetical protein
LFARNRIIVRPEPDHRWNPAVPVPVVVVSDECDFLQASGEPMLRGVFGTTATALAFVGAMGAAVAQTNTPQPSRNDPPPAAPNLSSKDTVPPATDSSLPTRGGKQEPSSKIEGTTTEAVLVNGILSVPGAQQDSQTAPAKFSERSNVADQLPIAAYALRHLSEDQRRGIYKTLETRLALSSETSAASSSVVGSEIPTEVALHGLMPLSEELVSKLPELRNMAFARAGNKMLLVDPSLRLVLAVLE